MEFLTVCIGAMRGCFSLHLNEAGILDVPDTFDLLSAGIFCYCTGDLYYW